MLLQADAATGTRYPAVSEHAYEGCVLPTLTFSQRSICKLQRTCVVLFGASRSAGPEVGDLDAGGQVDSMDESSRKSTHAFTYHSLW